MTTASEPEWLRDARAKFGTREAAGTANSATIMGWAKKLGTKVLGMAYMRTACRGAASSWRRASPRIASRPRRSRCARKRGRLGAEPARRSAGAGCRARLRAAGRRTCRLLCRRGRYILPCPWRQPRRSGQHHAAGKEPVRRSAVAGGSPGDRRAGGNKGYRRLAGLAQRSVMLNYERSRASQLLLILSRQRACASALRWSLRRVRSQNAPAAAKSTANTMMTMIHTIAFDPYRGAGSSPTLPK
jgi:hypothetical protein